MDVRISACRQHRSRLPVEAGTANIGGGASGCGQLFQRGTHPLEEELRINADPNDEQQERRERENLAGIQVADFFVVILVLRFAERAVKNPLIHPQHVPSAQHHAGNRQDGKDFHCNSAGKSRSSPGALERADQNQEFAHEAVQARQPDARQREDQHEKAQHGQFFGEAAIVGDLPRVIAVVDHAHHGEQPAGGKSVVDHLQHAAIDAQRIQGEKSQHAKAQVGHAGIGDELFEVFLRKRDERSVDDARRGQSQHPRHEQGRGIRKHRQIESQEAVGADLQQNARQDHAARGGRLHVSQGQPGVQRKKRDFDGETREQGQEKPKLQFMVHRPGEEMLRKQWYGERHFPIGKAGYLMRIVPYHDEQQPEEREHAAGEREEEKLDRRVAPLFAPPDADQEKQGDEREFEEHVEQEDVAGDEHAQHAGLEDQQQPVIERRLLRIASHPTSTAVTVSRDVRPKSQTLRPSSAMLKRISTAAPEPPNQGKSIPAKGFRSAGISADQNRRPDERRDRRRQRAAAEIHPIALQQQSAEEREENRR